jgi:hypothetical protein
MAIFLVIFAVSCTVATLLTITVAILSSRINHSKPIIEAYEASMALQNNEEFTLRTYSIEI